MLTQLNDEEWAEFLPLFEASLERRGDKAKNNRLFLEALFYFTENNIKWRRLPEQFGKWNSVWRRFDRLSKNGTFERLFELLSSCSKTAHLVQMIDSTINRAHVSAAGAKGGNKIRD